MSTKFKTADRYRASTTKDCETVLVVLLQALGTLKHTLRLVGGLVPRYLTPESPPDVPAHVGTTDVDVVLNVSMLSARGTYAKLRAQLKAHGFTSYEARPGKPSAWQWVYDLNGQQVRVEFLQNTDDPLLSGALTSVYGERISTCQFLYAGLVHDWYQEVPLTVELPGGNGLLTEIVRFADAVAFLTLKTMAFDERNEPKDAADLIHVMRYWEATEQLAALFARRLLDSAYSAALKDVLRRLEKRFCDDEKVEGWRKDGPAKFATFHQIGTPGDDDFVRAQRVVSGLVTYFIELVRSDPADQHRSSERTWT
jgi:hypothetical protein